MTPLAFFRLPRVERLLARAAACAGTPLVLHYQAAGQEGSRINAWGACEACRFVTQSPAGLRACRESRAGGSTIALQQRRPIPYLCHMGFACIGVPTPAGDGFVLTFGPFTPAEASQSLEHDALLGLEALDQQPRTQFPVSLDDIHRAPAGAVNGVADWTLEALARLWEEHHAGEVVLAPPAAEPGPVASPPRRPRAPGRLSSTNLPAAEIAAALATGKEGHARTLLRGALQETQASPTTALAVARARVVTLVSAVLEAAEQVKLITGSAWDAFPELLRAVRTADSEQALVDAAFGPLGQVRREAKRLPEALPNYAPLNDILLARLEEGITLEEVAILLKESPSAITHRLQRKFGMSFSEYQGRLRVNKAKELLRRTRLTATVVGQRVGIADQSNFSKLFRKFEGMAPLEYRERFGKKK